MKEEAEELAMNLPVKIKTKRIKMRLVIYFCCGQSGKKAGVDPETALQSCNLKFENDSDMLKNRLFYIKLQ